MPDLGKPLYEYDQCITLRDLYHLRIGMMMLADQEKETTVMNAIAVDTMLDFLDILIQWVNDGKPSQIKI